MFRLAFYIENNKISLDNFIDGPTSVHNYTTMSGISIWLGRGNNLYPPKNSRGEEIELKKYLDIATIEEIRDYLVETYRSEFSLTWDDTFKFIEIRMLSPNDSLSDNFGGGYQREYRVVHSVQAQWGRWIKLDLKLKGNRPFKELRNEIFSELLSVEMNGVHTENGDINLYPNKKPDFPNDISPEDE